MQSNTRRIRATIAALSVAIAVAAVPAVSPAAVNRSDDSGATPKTTPKKNKPPKERFKDAWGAGIPGYGDATCRSLMEDSNILMDAIDDAIARGDGAAVARYMAILDHLNKQLNNCVVLMG